MFSQLAVIVFIGAWQGGHLEPAGLHLFHPLVPCVAGQVYESAVLRHSTGTIAHQTFVPPFVFIMVFTARPLIKSGTHE